MKELVAKYIYDKPMPFGYYNVYAYYDSVEDFNERNVAFYDVHDSDGNCMSEDNPFYTFPTWNEIYEYYWLPTVREASQTLSRDLKRATK